MTSTFVEDRRSLMEHVTMLITQYHELLTQSLEDKEQYHLEEKNNTFVNILLYTYTHIQIIKKYIFLIVIS